MTDFTRLEVFGYTLAVLLLVALSVYADVVL
jgi:hypothetical protein